MELDKHYKELSTDVFQLLKDNATDEEAMGFLKYTAMKYLMRAKGQDRDDLRKIKVYCDEMDWWLAAKEEDNE